MRKYVKYLMATLVQTEVNYLHFEKKKTKQILRLNKYKVTTTFNMQLL